MHDEISYLRRQKTAQPAHAFDLADLVCDALFEFAVEPSDFLRLRFQLRGSLVQFFQ
jgi:hypothetical protein